MMKKTFLFLLFLFLVACSKEPSLMLTDEENETTISVKKGKTVEIILPENPSNGFRWQFLSSPKNTNLIANIKETYVPPEGRQIGVSGKKHYIFTVKKEGTMIIKGYIIRPWEVLDEKKVPKVTYTFEITK